MQTMSGWTPPRSILVHPPKRKVSALSGSKPAATQIWLHRSSQLALVRGSQPPSTVSNAKRVSLGTFPLADLWCFKAATGVVGSSMSVMVILAPLVPVVLDQGMLKLVWRVSRVRQCMRSSSRLSRRDSEDLWQHLHSCNYGKEPGQRQNTDIWSPRSWRI